MTEHFLAATEFGVRAKRVYVATKRSVLRQWGKALCRSQAACVRPTRSVATVWRYVVSRQRMPCARQTRLGNARTTD